MVIEGGGTKMTGTTTRPGVETNCEFCNVQMYEQYFTSYTLALQSHIKFISDDNGIFS